MYCTAVINGNVTSAVQSVAKPNAAPACAYVPMPEGSSSDALVTNPGPNIFRNRITAFDPRLWAFDVFDLSGRRLMDYRGYPTPLDPCLRKVNSFSLSTRCPPTCFALFVVHI